jgi:hypothetical protein
MIPLILTAELDEEFSPDWHEMRQFVVIKLAGIVTARFPATGRILGKYDREGIEQNAADWLRRKLI